MSNAQPQTSRRLCWWFWLVLFAPALFSLSVAVVLAASRRGWQGLAYLNLYVALPLNFVCANWAAKQIVLLRDPRGGSSPWMFLWGPLFFFLNVAVVFGGCALMIQGSR